MRCVRCPDGGYELVWWVAKHKPLLGDPIHHCGADSRGFAANSVLLLIWLEWRFAACPLFYRVAFNKFARWGGNKQNRQVDEQVGEAYTRLLLTDEGQG